MRRPRYFTVLATALLLGLAAECPAEGSPMDVSVRLDFHTTTYNGNGTSSGSGSAGGTYPSGEESDLFYFLHGSVEPGPAPGGGAGLPGSEPQQSWVRPQFGFGTGVTFEKMRRLAAEDPERSGHSLPGTPYLVVNVRGTPEVLDQGYVQLELTAETRRFLERDAAGEPGFEERSKSRILVVPPEGKATWVLHVSDERDRAADLGEVILEIEAEVVEEMP